MHDAVEIWINGPVVEFRSLQNAWPLSSYFCNEVERKDYESKDTQFIITCGNIKLKNIKRQWHFAFRSYF